MTTTATIQTAKQNLITLINTKGYVSADQYSMFKKITDAINYAYENWDANIIATYKTKEEFVQNWIENEDFEADGFDVERLISLFA